ncbi:MAG: hypothetical protein MJE63_22780 [Proteobacteria bacterium]|nr:hypothetical protein [Pseudomonadota bacterium]
MNVKSQAKPILINSENKGCLRVMQGSRRNKSKRKGVLYFNFSKFERQLDKLRQQGINVISADYTIKELKKFNGFKYYFENFTEQQIKAQLTFYAKQFEEPIE